MEGWGRGNLLWGRWGRDATGPGFAVAAAGVAAQEGAKRALVGHDGATFMAEEIAAVVAAGLAAQGVATDLLDNPVPAPAISHACRVDGIGLGFAIGAGAGAAQSAGMKIFGAGGRPLVPAISPPPAPKREGVPVRRRSGGGEAWAAAAATSRRRRARSLAVDLGHGAIKPYVETVLAGDEVVWRRADRRPAESGSLRHDGTEMRDLSREVVAGGHEAGLLMEIGAERYFLLDEKGDLVPNAIVQALALRALTKGRGRTGPLICSVDTSTALTAAAADLGVPTVFTASREADLWRALERQDGVMAVRRGNLTLVPEGAACGDALASLALLLEAWEDGGAPLSELVGDVLAKVGRRQTRTLALRLDEPTMDRVMSKFREEPLMTLCGVELSAVRDLDGIRTDYADGSWWLATFGPGGAMELAIESRKAAQTREMEAAVLAWAGL